MKYKRIVNRDRRSEMRRETAQLYTECDTYGQFVMKRDMRIPEMPWCDRVASRMYYFHQSHPVVGAMLLLPFFIGMAIKECLMENEELLILLFILVPVFFLVMFCMVPRSIFYTISIIVGAVAALMVVPVLMFAGMFCTLWSTELCKDIEKQMEK